MRLVLLMACCVAQAFSTSHPPLFFTMQAQPTHAQLVAACRRSVVSITEVHTLCGKLQLGSTSAADMRSIVDGKSWKVIYPDTDTHTPYTWRMGRVSPEFFYTEVPERVRRAVVEIISPSTDHLRRLHIAREDILAPTETGRISVKRLCWTFAAIATCGKFAHVRIDPQKLFAHRQITLQTASVPAIANPHLCNYYYLPIQRLASSPAVLNGGTTRDNNVVFASDTLCIMQNSWIRPAYPSGSEYSEADDCYMVCTRLGH